MILINYCNLERYCKTKRIQFFIANNFKLMVKVNADGLYISAQNKCLNLIKFRMSNYKIIGSAQYKRN